jgi:hypothetical protein
MVYGVCIEVFNIKNKIMMKVSFQVDTFKLRVAFQSPKKIRVN